MIGFSAIVSAFPIFTNNYVSNITHDCTKMGQIRHLSTTIGATLETYVLFTTVSQTHRLLPFFAHRSTDSKDSICNKRYGIGCSNYEDLTAASTGLLEPILLSIRNANFAAVGTNLGRSRRKT